jgi:uncharacterized tellurite resistance protein B-like protein
MGSELLELSCFDRDEGLALLNLMAWLSLVDGEIADAELSLLLAVAEQLGVGADDACGRVETLDVGALCATFRGPSTGRRVLAKLVELAWADGRYRESEERALAQLCDLLGISHEERLRVEAWVERGIAWRREAEGLFGASREEP